MIVSAQTSPNVIILFMDDMGVNDIGAYIYPSKASPGPPPATVSGGAGTIDVPPPNPAYDAGATSLSLTPRIDSLSDDGVRFTQFYSTHAVCTPTRASLMTGSYATRVRLENVVGSYADTNRNERGLNSTEVTLPELLRARGYKTGMTGKWHIGHDPDFNPIRHGFESYFGILYSNDMWEPNGSQPWGPLNVMRGETPTTSYTTDTGYTITNQINTDAEQSYLLEAITDEAVDFIDAAMTENKPFFLYYAPHTPHVPMHPHPDFLSAAGSVNTFAGRVARYYDVIEEIDARVGEILDRLAFHGIENNTLIIFTSDNGPSQSSTRVQAGELPGGGGSAYPFRGRKGLSQEGGHRVPFLARLPGQIPTGTVRDELGVTFDLYTTIANLTGASLPTDRSIDGVDIWPLLTGSDTSEPHSTFYYYRSGSTNAEAMIDLTTVDKWKYSEKDSSSGDLFKIGDGFTEDFQESFDVGATNSATRTSLNNQLSSWNSAITRRETGWVRNIHIEVENDAVTVDEDGTATTRIRLSGSTTKTIYVDRFSGDTDLDVTSGATINFNSGNWNSWQTVTFGFTPDSDTADGAATFRAYGNSIGSSSDIHVREIFVYENDTMVVNGAPDVSIQSPADAEINLVDTTSDLVLEATANDDGLPTPPAALTYIWSQLSGPVASVFASTDTANTSVHFPAIGDYTLQIEVSDSELTATDTVLVHVGTSTPGPTDSLAFRYAFEEGSGTNASDSSGNNRTATLSENGTSAAQGPTWSSGKFKFGGGLDFDGLNDLVYTPAIAVSNASAWSASAWVQLDSFASMNKSRVILQQTDTVSGTGRTWFYVKDDGALATFLGNATLEGGSISLDTWHHVAVTIGSGSSTTLRLYIDGQEVASDPGRNLESASGTFHIGDHKNITNTTSLNWDGKMDDLRVYTWALSATEVLNLFEEGLNVGPSVNAGTDGNVLVRQPFALNGTASDDGQPDPLTVVWSIASASGNGSFAAPDQLATDFTPETTGTYFLQLLAEDGVIKTLSKIQISVTESFTNWVQQFTEIPVADRDPQDDYEEDGIINLIEFALGGDPGEPDRSILPTLDIFKVEDVSYPGFTYRRRAGGSGETGNGYTVDGITYMVEFDNNLTLPPPWGDASFTVVSILDDTPKPGIQTVILRLNTSIETLTDPQFLRLKITIDP
jgi:arylsulfatase A-like enzyme